MRTRGPEAHDEWYSGTPAVRSVEDLPVRIGRPGGDHDRVRTVGVEEELLVVDPSGTPVPWAPAALRVAARRGEGETVEEHDRAGDLAAVVRAAVSATHGE
jgi:hypothetical protein